MPEIMMNDEFGRAIRRTIEALDVGSVIEVGSWDGTGSTAVLIHALEERADRRLTCIEPNPERFAALHSFTEQQEWITPVCQRSVSRASMTPQTFDDVWHSPYNRLPYNEGTVRAWWGEQRDGPGYLDSLINETWDAALIDGCEFCGYDDYRLLKDRVRVLMLDDVFRAYKCARAYEELILDSGWSCIWSSAFYRNGASIWARV